MSTTAATLSAFYRETWFTVEGARLKAKRLKARGVPNLMNWRFITCTVADRSVSPLTVYLRGKDKMRRFLAKWRECLGAVSDSFIGPLQEHERRMRWFWKLELHEDGYPHWHLLIDYLEKIPQEFFEEIESWWGLGRVNIGRVRRKEMHYVFKYVCKGGTSIPDWILDYPGRIRCVQASEGFFTGERREAKDSEPKSCLLKLPLRVSFGWDSRRAILTETSASGKSFVSVVRIPTPFAALLIQRARQAIRTKRPMASASSITLGQHQIDSIKNEHRKTRGLGCIHNRQFFESPGFTEFSIERAA